MRQAKRFTASGLVAVLLIAAWPAAAGGAEHEGRLSPTKPTLQQLPQQTAPRRPGQGLQVAPGGSLQVAPDRPGGIVLRTHCNGTCMCTGDDCTETWRNEYCKDDPVCSSDPGGANRVCSCVKKARQ